jgi:30S ribosomal protein S31
LPHCAPERTDRRALYNRAGFQLRKYGRNTMGKGDRRTRKGKIYRGSYGKTRPGRIKKKKGSKKQ